MGAALADAFPEARTTFDEADAALGDSLSRLCFEGPDDQLSRSYEKALAYAKARGLRLSSPCREVYLKGPGMFFRGNPKNYLTEIQLMVEGQ